ncbi:unnamed protein product [Prunus armeniaca]|uniref:Non-specific lipid-transfer protein n=1 Tax=Prunus armeniaca TaxID=36596 RepID=A0A6J5XD64_PRUAR|nr:unnamed protein product [Prunus armeniaca]
MTRLTKITIVIMSLVSGSAMGDLPSCETILEPLNPCAKQQNNDVKPPQTCCDAIQSLSRYSNDKEDRHEICDCIKAVAILAGLPINDFSCISFLPQACGLSVKLPPISTDIDCSQEDLVHGVYVMTEFDIVIGFVYNICSGADHYVAFS